MKIEINKKFNNQAKQTLLASMLALSTLGLSGCDLMSQDSPTDNFKAQPDKSVPVISLTGGAIELFVGDSYVELGVSAEDNIDGDVSANVAIGGDTVDTSVVGTYTLTYNVSDAAGNAAEQVSRSVVVSAVPVADTTAPVITLTDDEVQLNVGDTYAEPGVSAVDEIDGDISANVIVAGDTVDTSAAGTYTLTYNVSDAAGNAAEEVSREVVVSAVIVADLTAPVITLTVGTELNVGDTYAEPGVSAIDNIDGDVSANVVIAGDTVDTSTEGTYTLTYNVSDSAGNVAEEVSREVVVLAANALDETAPVITLTDGAVELLVGETYVAPGFIARDNKDGDVSDNVVIAGDTVDTSIAGTYTLTYNVSDAAGNAAVEVSREVVVSGPVEVPVAEALLSITDAGLKTCLEERIAAKNYNAETDETTEIINVSQLRDLDCSGVRDGNFGTPFIRIKAENDRKIESLVGLDNFTALTNVKFSYNLELSDIKELADLDLQVLKLDWTKVDDAALEVIANHSNLRVLNLNGAYLIKDGTRASEVLATLEKMVDLGVWILGSDVYGSEGNAKNIPGLKDGKLGDFSYVGNMPSLEIFNSGGQEYSQGFEGFNNTPLVNNINFNGMKWKANIDLTPLMSFDKAGLNVMFLQGGPTLAICEKIFDVVQHFAPEGVFARERTSYEGDGANDMLLAPPATDKFIRLDNVCLNTL